MASQNFVTRPGSQFVQSGTGAVERTVTDKLKDTVSIKDFGAIPGDESAASTNVLAIQAALDYVASLSFGAVKSVFIPAGTFVVDSDLIIPSYVTLFGEGDQSIIKLKADVSAGTYNLLKITSDGANSIVLKDFSLWGDNNNQVNNPTVYGIRISPASSPVIYSNFINLYVKEMSSCAVFIDSAGCDNSTFLNCMFRDSKGVANVYTISAKRVEFIGCRVRAGKVGAGHGFALDGAGNRFNTISNCRIDDNSGWGVVISNAQDKNVVTSNTLISNDGGGIYVDRSSNSMISQNHLTSNGTSSAAIRVDTEGFCLIDGNQIFEVSGHGIYMKNADDSLCTNNLIHYIDNASFLGIYCDVVDRATVSNNHIVNAQGSAIAFNNSNFNLIQGNHIVNAGLATNDTYYGILIDNNSDYNLVQANKVTTNQTNKVKYSCYIGSGTGDQNMVINNDLISYATAGLQDSGVGTITTSANRT